MNADEQRRHFAHGRHVLQILQFMLFPKTRQEYEERETFRLDDYIYSFPMTQGRKIKWFMGFNLKRQMVKTSILRDDYL